jgi:hypothetical protein
MKVLRVIPAAAVFGGLLVALSTATPQYASKEHKKCADCHAGSPAQKKFTDMGQYYKDHNHSLEGYKAPEKKN